MTVKQHKRKGNSESIDMITVLENDQNIENTNEIASLNQNRPRAGTQHRGGLVLQSAADVDDGGHLDDLFTR